MTHTKQNYLDAFEEEVWRKQIKVCGHKGTDPIYKLVDGISAFEAFISQMYDALTQGETEECLCHCHVNQVSLCRTDGIEHCSHCRKEQA